MADRIEEVKRLAELRDKGDITDTEYQRLKNELLSGSSESAPQAPSATNALEPQTRWWLIGTGVLMAVGSFLPWASAGIFSAAGTDGDGILTLIGGVMVGLVGVANKASLTTGLGTIVVAALSLVIVVNVFGNFGAEDIGLVGSGLYLTGLASLFAAIAGFKVFGESRRSA